MQPSPQQQNHQQQQQQQEQQHPQRQGEREDDDDVVMMHSSNSNDPAIPQQEPTESGDDPDEDADERLDEDERDDDEEGADDEDEDDDDDDHDTDSSAQDDDEDDEEEEEDEQLEEEQSPRKPRPSPLPPSSFLAPGQVFSGSQTVNQPQTKNADEWRVNVHIQAVDWHRGRVSGSMEALDVPKALAPVVTFWQGEIVDNRNYFFRTGRWDADVVNDVDHWKKFVGFAPLLARVSKDRGDDIDLASSRYLFMRWKEIFFVSPGEDCGLTIAGFYYVCMDRFTGSMLGYYYDPKSQPYQRLQLNAVSLSGGHAFSIYEFN